MNSACIEKNNKLSWNVLHIFLLSIPMEISDQTFGKRRIDLCVMCNWMEFVNRSILLSGLNRM